MLKRFKSVSLLLLTAGFTSSGIYAAPNGSNPTIHYLYRSRKGCYR